MKAVEISPMPLRGAQVWPLTTAAYHALGEAGLIPKNTELLYGYVYRKMPKSPLHCFLINRLMRFLQTILPKDCLLRSEQPITSGDSEPEPDISVVRGAEDDYWTRHPATAELVIEVCVTTHDYDRSKLRTYAAAGVKECWLVLGPERQIEAHREPAGGQFTRHELHGPGGRLASAAIPEFALDLDTLFSK